MTTLVDVLNRALQDIGTRTTVASLAEQSNEAIQGNLILAPMRDQLLRMAPWNCGMNFIPLNYITSIPGSPENPSQVQQLWAKGIPAPPWAYEYQYPVDCLKALFVVPQFQTGFASGIPITTAITGGAPSFWNGPPAKFKVGVDQFYAVNAATVAAGGSGYVVGDQITLDATKTGAGAPNGAGAVLQVATLSGSAVATVTVVASIAGETVNQSGSYFTLPTNPVAQLSTTGVGVGATFTCTFTAKGDQRIILTNQEDALLCYIKQITDPNVFDPQFLEAWIAVVGAKLVMALTGDKSLANMQIQKANSIITEARKNDANEGLTINNVTPDWIRIRGIDYPTDYGWSPNVAFDWGPMFSTY